MSSWKVALTDQSTAGVPLATLQQIAPALQQQVDNDFAPAWGARADISALAPGDPVPPGTWLIKIVDDIGGGGGVHLDDEEQPYAEAVNGPQLSIAISRELLEMLADPWGNRFTPAADLDPSSDGHQVFYLVEVGDPCEVTSYQIDGVAVSDFILPAFYDPNASGQVDLRGTLAGPLPRPVPQGCYISWIDPQDRSWHQQKPDGTFITAPPTPARTHGPTAIALSATPMPTGTTSQRSTGDGPNQALHNSAATSSVAQNRDSSGIAAFVPTTWDGDGYAEVVIFNNGDSGLGAAIEIPTPMS